MTRLCAVVALACVAVAAGGGAAANASEAGADASQARADASRAGAAAAEARARAAVAPLVVERAVCLAQSRRRTVCLLAHPVEGGLECRSTVVVRPKRVRVIQRNVCFEFREVTP
jgi:hypothetical protein